MGRKAFVMMLSDPCTDEEYTMAQLAAWAPEAIEGVEGEAGAGPTSGEKRSTNPHHIANNKVNYNGARSIEDDEGEDSTTSDTPTDPYDSASSGSGEEESSTESDDVDQGEEEMNTEGDDVNTYSQAAGHMRQSEESEKPGMQKDQNNDGDLEERQIGEHGEEDIVVEFSTEEVAEREGEDTVGSLLRIRRKRKGVVCYYLLFYK